VENRISYRCPHCKNENILEFEEIIYCPLCKLDYYKKYFGELKEEDMLSLQELHEFRENIEE
jgi:hypothetical protein